MELEPGQSGAVYPPEMGGYSNNTSPGCSIRSDARSCGIACFVHKQQGHSAVLFPSGATRRSPRADPNFAATACKAPATLHGSGTENNRLIDARHMPELSFKLYFDVHGSMVFQSSDDSYSTVVRIL
jgi:hypothetical protein